DADQVVLRVVGVLAAAVELVRSQGRFAHALELTEPVTSPVHEAPRASRAEVVAVRIAKFCRADCLCLDLRVIRVGIDLEPETELREPRVQLRALVAGPIRELDRFRESPVRLVEAAGPEEGVAEVAEQLGALRVVGRHQGEGTSPQLEAGVDVAAGGGGPARGGEPVGRASCQLLPSVAERTQLREIPVRLFQMPPDDLRVLAPPFSRAELE